MKIIITENQFNLLLEVSNPCPKGVEIDPLVTIDELKSGKKTIKKGYCNYSENSAIVKVQQMLKKQGYSLGDSAEGYYGDKTQEAIIDLWLKKNNKNVLGTEIGQKTLELFSDEKKSEESTPKKETGGSNLEKVTKEEAVKLFNGLTYDQKLIVSTLLGEAGGEKGGNQPYEGMLAVANVLKNRSKSNHGNYGTTMAKQAIAKTPKSSNYQFSIWNNGIDNLFQQIKNHDAMKIAIYIMKNIKSLPDNTNGAEFYYATWLDKAPYWATERDTTSWVKTKQVGQHVFGNVVDKKTKK